MGKKTTENPYARPGETAGMIRHLQQVACLGPRVNLNNDPEGVQQRVAAYFDLCMQNDVKPSQAALAMSLGITRNALYQWRKGIIGTNEKTRDILIYAQSVLESLMEQYMEQGMIHPVAGIFLMRNNYGYKNEDVPAADEDARDALPQVDIKSLAAKYDVPEPDPEEE